MQLKATASGLHPAREAHGRPAVAGHPAPNRHRVVTAAVADLLHSLDAASIVQGASSQLAAAPAWQQAVEGVTGRLPAGLTAPEAVQQLQAAVQQLSELPGNSLADAARQVDGLTSALAGSASQQQAAAAGYLAGLLAPLGGSAAGVVDQALQALPAGVVDQALQALPAGGLNLEQLPPHWGSLAAQGMLQNLGAYASQLPTDLPAAAGMVDSLAGLGQSLGASGTAALQELQAALPAGLDAATATQAAAEQLQQAVQALLQAQAAASAQGAGGEVSAQLSQLASDLQALLAAVPAFITPPAAPADSFQAAAAQGALARLSQVFAETAQQGSWAGHDLVTLSLAGAGMMLGVAVSMQGVAPPDATQEAVSAELELGYEYDPQRLAEYFQRRPVLVMQRAALVAAEGAALGMALLLDLARGGLAVHEADRAVQLRGIIERLGPAYVKVAQAMSTRVDLLTPAYFMQIQLLQDRVPPFSDSVARDAMVRAFGAPLNQVFTQLSDKPVAAASLGQVYRATLVPERGGGDVAIKVQRPGVLAQVALDLYLMRGAAQALQPQLRSDWVGIIDAWAMRFFHEMDYCREADNARQFQQDMASLQGITVPETVAPLSNHNVLTTRWIEGEKLGESTADDVRTLCNTLLTAYLIQLLDTGNLHADPHPGNLLRTPDGRIAILDFGLMTEVTEAQRWALLEYIAHLSTRDWRGVARDLQALGFIPPEVDPEEAGLVEPLGRIMEQLVGGGGAAKVNIDKVLGDLEELGQVYPFRVPAFFALILRAFSVIEGIALGVDPDYSIVAECLPYLSRRLLSDDSPRARAVLRDLLYGGRQRLDVERLMQLADAFSSYTTDGLTEQGVAAAGAPRVSMSDLQQRVMVPGGVPRSPALGQVTPAGAAAATAAGTAGLRSTARSSSTTTTTTTSSRRTSTVQRPVLPPAVKDALLLVFSRQGSYVQELLVEEAAAAVDALSRRAAGSLLLSLTTGAALPGATGPLSGGLRGAPPTLPFPFPAPLPLLSPDAASRLQPFVALSKEDEEALGVVRGVSTLLTRAILAAAGTTDDGAGGDRASRLRTLRAGVSLVQPLQVRATLAELLPLAPQLAPGLLTTWLKFNTALWSRAQARLRQAAASPRAPAPASATSSPAATAATATSGTWSAPTATAPVAAAAPVPVTTGVAPGTLSVRALRAGSVASEADSNTALWADSSSSGTARAGWGADDLLGGGTRIKSTAASRRV